MPETASVKRLISLRGTLRWCGKSDSSKQIEKLVCDASRAHLGNLQKSKSLYGDCADLESAMDSVYVAHTLYCAAVLAKHTSELV